MYVYVYENNNNIYNNKPQQYIYMYINNNNKYIQTILIYIQQQQKLTGKILQRQATDV